MSARLRTIDRANAEEITLVASRMRETLIEVLGEARGHALYTLAWLEDRVRWHLDPACATGEVFLAQDDAGLVVGHTIVRLERDDAGPFGLFSTTFVVPDFRKRGIATMLRLRGEAWMLDHRMPSAATDTAESNGKLIALFTRAGYTPILHEDEMVRLARAL